MKTGGRRSTEIVAVHAYQSPAVCIQLTSGQIVLPVTQPVLKRTGWQCFNCKPTDWLLKQRVLPTPFASCAMFYGQRPIQYYFLGSVEVYTYTVADASTYILDDVIYLHGRF